jgi:hypothetical protein
MALGEDAENVCDYWHPCPFGAVGDRIWVRETWAILGNEDGCCIDWEENFAKRMNAQRRDLPR